MTVCLRAEGGFRFRLSVFELGEQVTFLAKPSLLNSSIPDLRSTCMRKSTRTPSRRTKPKRLRSSARLPFRSSLRGRFTRFSTFVAILTLRKQTTKPRQFSHGGSPSSAPHDAFPRPHDPQKAPVSVFRQRNGRHVSSHPTPRFDSLQASALHAPSSIAVALQGPAARDRPHAILPAELHPRGAVARGRRQEAPSKQSAAFLHCFVRFSREGGANRQRSDVQRQASSCNQRRHPRRGKRGRSRQAGLAFAQDSLHARDVVGSPRLLPFFLHPPRLVIYPLSSRPCIDTDQAFIPKGIHLVSTVKSPLVSYNQLHLPNRSAFVTTLFRPSREIEQPVKRIQVLGRRFRLGRISWPEPTLELLDLLQSPTPV